MPAPDPVEVRRANDVARQHAHLPVEEAALAVAAHLRTFWDPRMRADLVAWVREPGSHEALLPAARAAAQLLDDPGT